MRIGLTLSGGGFRATVFHLGVLARLALEKRLEEVVLISTVSGGSLCAGLVYGLGGGRWPTSAEFTGQFLPKVREILTTQDLGLGLAWRALHSPLKLLEPRAHVLSELIQEQWGLTVKLCDLPPSPRWLINTTCYETGKNWRFESFRMGDYVFGYSSDTDLPAADGVAASSGFPGLIGALVLNTRGRRWYRYVEREQGGLAAEEAKQAATQPIEPMSPFVHLWDGGVYDNFGMEGAFDIGKGWRKDIEFLILSDASGFPGTVGYQPGVKAMLRIVDIMMDQIRSLRTRAVLDQIIGQKEQGLLLRNSNTCSKLLKDLDDPAREQELAALCQDDEAAARSAAFPTVIRRLTPGEFDLLFRHGYEVANCTLYLHGPEHPPFLAYRDSPWAGWS
jgi:NTE family protein